MFFVKLWLEFRKCLGEIGREGIDGDVRVENIAIGHLDGVLIVAGDPSEMVSIRLGLVSGDIVGQVENEVAKDAASILDLPNF